MNVLFENFRRFERLFTRQILIMAILVKLIRHITVSVLNIQKTIYILCDVDEILLSTELNGAISVMCVIRAHN